MYNKLTEFQRNGFDKKLMKELKDQIWQPSNILDKDRTIVEIADIKPKIELVEKLIKLEKENLHLQYVCRECLTIFRKLNEDMEKYNEH